MLLNSKYWWSRIHGLALSGNQLIALAWSGSYTEYVLLKTGGTFFEWEGLMLKCGGGFNPDQEF